MVSSSYGCFSVSVPSHLSFPFLFEIFRDCFPIYFVLYIFIHMQLHYYYNSSVNNYTQLFYSWIDMP